MWAIPEYSGLDVANAESTTRTSVPILFFILTGGAGRQVLLSIYYVLQETLVQPGFEGYQMNNRVSRVAQQRRVRSVFDGFRSVLISF